MLRPDHARPDLLIEACVDSVESAHAAQREGADRIELCACLDVDGTTPPWDSLERALSELTVPVFPMIRPRGGNFVYDAAEVAGMRVDLARARDLGAPGAVIGALTAAGDVDERTVATLRADAPDMQLTFHRAFDECGDPHATLDQLIALGIDRVLTSGQQPTAWEGRALLGELVRQAAGRIVVMACGGVRGDHVAELVRASGVQEVHLRTVPAGRLAGVVQALQPNSAERHRAD